MARKQTEDEKALRKAATSLRNKAHGERVREFRRRTDEAVAAVHASHAAAIEEASRRTDAHIAEQQVRLADIDRQISELQEKRNAVIREGSEAYEPLRQARSDAYARRREDEEGAKEAALSLYPDLRGNAQFSAPCWKDIEEFMGEAGGTSKS